MSSSTSRRARTTDDADEELLAVANFLTQFGDYFRGDDERTDDTFTISPKMVQDALEYQQGLASSGHTVHYPMVVHVYRMLLRLQIWLTKDLVQSLMMKNNAAATGTSSNSTSSSGRSSYSSILNLPSSDHFIAHLPSLGATFPRTRHLDINPQKLPSICVTPNKWTWDEYFRLVYMVSLLEKPKLLHNTCPTTFHKTQDPSEKSTPLTETDLVSIWVRAQRNTVAWRHLHLLFAVEEVASEEAETETTETTGEETETTGEEAVQVEGTTTASVVDTNFLIRYRGKCEGIKSSILRDSPLVDGLVEWAVLNQVMLTNPYMKEFLRHHNNDVLSFPDNVFADLGERRAATTGSSTGDTMDDLDDGEAEESNTASDNSGPEGAPPNDKKRSHGEEEDDDNTDTHNRKKARHDFSEAENDYEYYVSKCSFVLKWFARRHRQVLSYLYQSHIMFDWPIYRRLMQEFDGQKDLRKNILRECRRESRISEKIPSLDRVNISLQGPDSQFENRPKRFVEVITTVLKAFEKSQTQLGSELFDAALDDWTDLTDKYLRDAASLGPNDALRAPKQVLDSVVAPWLECCGCKKTVKKNDIHVTCANCEKLYHATCCDCDEFQEATKSLVDVVSSYEPLKMVYTYRLPRLLKVPMAREYPDLTWTELKIHVQDIRAHNGLRISVQHAEENKRVLTQILSSQTLVSETELSDEKSDLNQNVLLSVDVRGMLVTELLKGSPCAKAGLQPGDYITHVQFENREASEDVSEMSIVVRERLISAQNYRKMCWFTVQRPSVSLLSAAKKWKVAFKRKANKSLKGALPSLNSTVKEFFCPHCIADTPSAPQDVKADAKRCLAVIRSMAMESYAEPFLAEDKLADHNNPMPLPASLRRLDEIMVSILNEKESVWAYSHPPQIGDDSELISKVPRRLSWLGNAAEVKPREILCKGMEIIVSSPAALGIDKDDSYSEERSALAARFVRLFPSWCLRCTTDIGCIATIGPLTDFTMLTNPFGNKSCVYCMLPIENEKMPTATSCQRPACLAIKEIEKQDKEKKLNALDEKLAAANPVDTAERIRLYDSYASLVGTVLLILPDDPLIEHTVQSLPEFRLKNRELPVQYIIASYLPSEFVDLKTGRCIKEKSDDFDGCRGIFHLFPVISGKQVAILKKFADGQWRDSPTFSTANFSRAWASLEILSLKGVTCMSPQQVMARLQRTSRIQEAISGVVARQASCISGQEMKARFRVNSLRVDLIMSEGNDTAASREYDASTDERSISSDDEIRCAGVSSLTAKPLKRFDTAKVMTGALINIAVATRSAIVDKLLESVDCVSEKTPFLDPFESILEKYTGASLTIPEDVIGHDNQHRQSAVDQRRLHQISLAQHSSNSPNGSQASITMIDDMNFEPTLDIWSNAQNDMTIPMASEELQPSIVQQSRPSQRSGGIVQCFVPQGNGLAVQPQVHPLSIRTQNPQVAHEQPQNNVARVSPQFETQGNPCHSQDVDLPARRFLRLDDLGKFGPIGTCVSCAEASFVVWCLARNHDCVARRSLSPRYRYTQGREQVTILKFLDTADTVPQMPDGLAHILLRKDYERSEKETGEIVDRHGGMESRIPVAPLSIDAVAYAFFSRSQVQAQVQNQHPSPVGQHGQMFRVAPHAQARAFHGAPCNHQLQRSPLSNQSHHPTNFGHQQFNHPQRHMNQLPPSPVTWGRERDFQPPIDFQVPIFDRQHVAAAPEHGVIDLASPDQEERIRGGGPGTCAGRKLVDVPKSEWTKHAVYCDGVKTRGKDGQMEKVWVLAFLTEEDSEEINLEKFVMADVFYYSDCGILCSNEVPRHKLKIKSCSLVVEGSEESRFVQQYLDMRASDTTRASDTVEHEVHLGASRSECTKFKSNLLAIGNGATLLGRLPDGRGVYWMPSRPREINLRLGSTSNRHFVELVKALSKHFAEDICREATKGANDHNFISIESTYPCFYGCSCSSDSDNLRRSLAFADPADLVTHLKKHHQYGMPSSGGIFMLPKDESELVLQDITSALCARWPPFLEITRKTDAANGESFVQSPVDGGVSFNVQGEGWEQALSIWKKGYSGDKVAFLKLLALWSKIDRVYGHADHSKIDLPNTCFVQNEMTRSYFQPAKDCLGSAISPSQLRFSQCIVCCGDGERGLHSTIGGYASLGCSFLSSTFDDHVPPVLSQGQTSQMTMAKSAIKHTASNTPQVLRLSIDITQMNMRQTQPVVVWDDGQFQQWCQFVDECTTARGLCQALVVLLNGLVSERMPTWWKSNKAGWSKPAALLAQPSTGQILLHIYVLDAAMTETRWSGTPDASNNSGQCDPIPPALREMSIVKRMKVIVKWAKDLNYPRHAEEHSVECVTCQDGGDVICCEFCEKVQHPGCYKPPIVNPDDIDEWVCDSCIKDISEMRESHV